MLKFRLFCNYQMKNQNVLPKPVLCEPQLSKIGGQEKVGGWEGRTAPLSCAAAPPSSQHLQSYRAMVCALCVIALKLVRCIKQGSYGHEKPGKFMEIENAISRSLKSYWKMKSSVKFWKSHWNIAWIIFRIYIFRTGLFKNKYSVTCD